MQEDEIELSTKNELLSISSDCDEGTVLDNGYDGEDDVRRFFKWSGESTKLLLTLRFHQDSAFSNPKSKKKQLWDSVADDMYRIGGYRISGVLCDLKFRNMLHTFKKNRLKENSGNANLIVWEYYKLFKDAVGHKFNKSRTNNLPDSMMYEDTMLEAPNETMELPDEPPKDTDKNLDKNTVDQDNESTVDFQPHSSSKRKINENNCNEGVDCNNIVNHCSADFMATPLTEDEKNECTAFGNSVACQLLNIKDSYSRALTKLKMQKILFLAQTGRLALNNERL